MRIKKGDNVEIISGKDRGKQGEVLKVFPDEDRVIVEGINIVHKHKRATRDMPQGGIIENEAPVHISNVMLVCPRCEERSKFATETTDKGKTRICKTCGELIDE